MKEQNTKVKLSYETIWKFIIRPKRDIYKEEYLGSNLFMYKGRNYTRKDYDIVSSEGYLMKCSFFEPEDLYRPRKIMPVVLYLHGNSSSRLEGIFQIKELIRHDINLFVVDLPGCGLSEGEYISLGYHERNDVKILVDFIENLPGVGYIGLWGRSMGAATTMLYAHKDERIKAIVMDSPFADFNILAKEITHKQIKLPNFLIDGALKILKMTVKKKNGLDIDKLKPIEAAQKTTQPAMFIHAYDDELINIRHSEMLLKAYRGKYKILKKVKGTHNSIRSEETAIEIAEFFYKHLVNHAQTEEDNFSTIANKSEIIESENDEDLKTEIEYKNNIKINNDNNNNNESINVRKEFGVKNRVAKDEIIENDDSFNDDKISDIGEHLAKLEQKNNMEIEFLPQKIKEEIQQSGLEKINIDVNNDVDEETK